MFSMITVDFFNWCLMTSACDCYSGKASQESSESLAAGEPHGSGKRQEERTPSEVPRSVFFFQGITNRLIMLYISIDLCFA